ncbi:MAG: chromosomal replication initiation ATPase DnaA [Candidatus Midichloriaceae bacterium]|jgi:chromosomal replication initiation ATPase DnaA
MQKILDLHIKSHSNFNDDFMVSYSNFEASNAIKDCCQWKDNRVLIIGPKCSGKTLIANLWRKNSEAVFLQKEDDLDSISENGRLIIDDIENFKELQLVNIINFTNEKSISLLLTATSYPIFKLSDLNSRIKSMYKILIKQPDENLIKHIIHKLFLQKQIIIPEEVINYMLSNIERTYEFINEIIDLIDKLSKVEKRKITIPFIRDIFINYYNIDAV